MRRDELLLSRRCQAIELRAAIVLADPPLRRDEAPLLELMERRIERPFLDLQDVASTLLDPSRDPVAMSRRPGERLEDHEVERPFEKIDGSVWHARLAAAWELLP